MRIWELHEAQFRKCVSVFIQEEKRGTKRKKTVDKQISITATIEKRKKAKRANQENKRRKKETKISFTLFTVSDKR